MQFGMPILNLSKNYLGVPQSTTPLKLLEKHLSLEARVALTAGVIIVGGISTAGAVQQALSVPLNILKPGRAVRNVVVAALCGAVAAGCYYALKTQG